MIHGSVKHIQEHRQVYFTGELVSAQRQLSAQPLQSPLLFDHKLTLSLTRGMQIDTWGKERQPGGHHTAYFANACWQHQRHEERYC